MISKLWVVFVCIGVAFATTVDPATEDVKTTTENVSPKTLERMLTYRNSIWYWDTENPETRNFILGQLAAPEDLRFEIPGCPRIRFPLICDEEGTITENICYFRMKRRQIQDLKPIMVFTSTPIEDAQAKCSKEFKLKP